MIISVHIPKTAGTSFLSSLSQHFGPRLKKDYRDYPVDKYRLKAHRQEVPIAEIMKKFDCIHGHFFPIKYIDLAVDPSIKFVCWLRDPVDRLISHYNYWTKVSSPKTHGGLHMQVVKEGWTLEKFCFSQELHNFYTKFLAMFPFDCFDFIGITEHYAEDFQFFCKKFLGANLPVVKSNTNAGNKPVISASMIDEIRMFHAKDVLLYSKALELRKKRLS